MSATKAKRKRRARGSQAPARPPGQAYARKPPPVWQPMERSRMTSDPQLAELADQDPEVASLTSREVWLGGWAPDNLYVVTVRRHPEEGWITLLSIRRVDRKAVYDWRDFQRIKNEIAGRNVEGMSIYPAWDRTVDTANQYWIWCLPPGVKIPGVGFDEGRKVTGDNDPRFPMSRQRSFRRGEKDAI